jgi:hypothetical protein
MKALPPSAQPDGVELPANDSTIGNEAEAAAGAAVPGTSPETRASDVRLAVSARRI